MCWCSTDGSFRIERVPSAQSYVVHVVHTQFTFEPVRVDVTSRGKMRARRCNLLRPNDVKTLPYPLRYSIFLCFFCFPHLNVVHIHVQEHLYLLVQYL